MSNIVNVVKKKKTSKQPTNYCCCSMKVQTASLRFCGCFCLWFLVISMMLLQMHQRQLFISAAPTHDSELLTTNRLVWPAMKHYDIWSSVDDDDAADGNINRHIKDNNDDYIDHTSAEMNSNDSEQLLRSIDDVELIGNTFSSDTWKNSTTKHSSTRRQSKVIHIFPVPVDGECLANDGRRTGTCFNAYECRLQGGVAKGECAMGFGVCCIFIASCNQTIANNITYLVSPNFPSFMTSNFTACSLKVKMLNEDISQLRIDFHHFSLGQPNRRTGVCDGDVFNVSGGPSGTFSLCGQNSGQHIYYDVGGRALPRQNLYATLRPLTYDQLYPNRTESSANGTTFEELVEITMTFTNRFLPIRLWEIRIAQIPFSQRAPAGCLQYHTGTEGIIQTFNFAENGRHLANQRYRICMRQETEMCSIMYEPCDEQSFRIGSNMPLRTALETDNTFESSVPSTSAATAVMSSSVPTISRTTTTALTTTTTLETTTAASTTASTTATTTSTTTTTIAASTPRPDTTISSADAVNGTDDTATSTTNITTTTTASILNDEFEGSGDDSNISTPSASSVTPVRGGFDILGFLRSAFDIGFHRKSKGFVQTQQLKEQQQHPRRQRQFFSTCTDRITMPCIIEDFIGAGLGPLPGCEPVHCGSQFCSSGMNPCRIESTVTPFYIGINFGDGASKGSAEDNIGACLRYTQVQCM